MTETEYHLLVWCWKHCGQMGPSTVGQGLFSVSPRVVGDVLDMLFLQGTSLLLFCKDCLVHTAFLVETAMFFRLCLVHMAMFFRCSLSSLFAIPRIKVGFLVLIVRMPSSTHSGNISSRGTIHPPTGGGPPMRYSWTTSLQSPQNRASPSLTIIRLPSLSRQSWTQSSRRN